MPPPAPPPEKPPPPPNPPNPPNPPPPPPLQPLPPPQQRPMPPNRNGSRKMRPRLSTIRSTIAMMNPPGMCGVGPCSGGGRTSSGADSVTPNSCANACAIRSTPTASPAAQSSRADDGGDG